MKRILVSLLFISSFVCAQNKDSIVTPIGYNKNGQLVPATTIAQNVTVKSVDSISNSVAPYMRISTLNTLALTTSWQTVTFSNKGASQDTNKFSVNTATGNKWLRYDTTVSPRLMKFELPQDANFLGTLYLSYTTSGITTRSDIQYRFVIPNGVSPGVDYYFPFPNNGSYGTISEATLASALASSVNIPHEITIYLSSALRTNGMYLQLRLSNSLVTLATCTINNAALLIQQTK